MRQLLSISRCRGVCAGMAAGMLVAALALPIASLTGGAATAEDQAAAQQHFLSGGERSAVVLREIQAVLERIDGRLERIETLMAKSAQAQAAQPQPPPTLPLGGTQW